MPRKNSKRSRDKVIKKIRTSGKRSAYKSDGDVGLRRSERRRSDAYASSKITSKRLTLPLTFLDKAVKSETVTVSKKKEDVAITSGRNRHILNEDLLALIPAATSRNERNNSGSLADRRITRSLNKRFVNASSYYFSCISNRATCSDQSKTKSITDETHTELDDIKEDSQEDSTVEEENTTFERSISTTANRQQINYKFCTNIFRYVKLKIHSSTRTCFLHIKAHIKEVNDILDGKIQQPPSKMSTKRHCDEDYEKCGTAPLVPQSQWVYSTPDKQNIKKFVFEEGSEKILPAVIRTSKKTKVLYDIKNEVVQQINLNKYKSGQNIPIDRRYLKTICENIIDKDDDAPTSKPAKKQRTGNETDKENLFTFVAPAPKTDDFVFLPQQSTSVSEFNVFLSGTSEESIDIREEIERSGSEMDLSFEDVSMEDTTRRFDFRQCRSALPKESIFFTERDPYEAAPIDYHHQLLLATQRPAKTARRIQKRHILKAKSLSFENTPPSSKNAVFEPKRLDMVRKMEEDCLDHFEEEFPTLNLADSYKPHTITSGALEESETEESSRNGFKIETPITFKYYPRRNFDPE